MAGFVDLAGKRFERLLVIRRVIVRSRQPYWYCICDCGNEAVVASTNLTANHTKSCGCFQSDFCKSRFSTHGLRNHPLYGIWSGIFQRCTKKYSSSWKKYGARGVTVCREWHDFKTFYDWAIANGWKSGLEVDKDIIPIKLGIPALLYSPEMCSIVTPKVNARSRSATKLDEQKAIEIRESKDKTSVLMARYGVGKTTINNIRSNRSWV